MTDETLKQHNDAILTAIADLSKKIDDYKKETDEQLEVIREGISYNATRLDRIEGNFLLLRADVREMTEEMRKDKLALK